MFWRRTPAVKKFGKVVLFGASSPVGQPLSLLLKLCPHVEELVCCGTSLDSPTTTPAGGVCTDLSHIDTTTTVQSIEDVNGWAEALHDAQLVLVCSGNSFDPLREDSEIAIRTTAPAVEPVMRAVAASKSTAVIAVVSSPVNSLTPLCAEWLKQEGAFDPRKLLGVTSLDVMRTRKMVAEVLGMNAFDVNVPVVGGRGGLTACPLIAQTGLRIPSDEIVRITTEVQQYGAPFASSSLDGETGASELTTAVAPPVALSLAQAAYEFSVSLLKAQRGDLGIIECALVESTMRREVPFFSSRVQLGAEGVDSILPMGKLSVFESELIEAAIPELARDIEIGLAYAGKKKE